MYVMCQAEEDKCSVSHGTCYSVILGSALHRISDMCPLLIMLWALCAG